MHHLPIARSLRAAGAAIVLCSVAAHADAQMALCAPNLTSLQFRMLLAAQKSPEDLRRFIDIRRTMLQIDVGETQAWAANLLHACPIDDAAAMQAVDRRQARAAAPAATPLR
jgi:hypothetical protein